MLDFFRNHQRLMMFLLLLIVLPGLGMVGVQGFRGFFDESGNLASVDGHKITRVAFNDAFRQQTDQARQQMGAQFDQQAFDTPQRRTALLDSMIDQQTLLDQVQRLHLTVSDQTVRQALLSDPTIASLKQPDGSIDAARYTALLAMQGMTPDQFQEVVRHNLTLQQIPRSIEASAFAPRSLAQNLTQLAEQQRDVQVLAFKAADYASKVQPTDAQLAAYYDAHKQAFATPETAAIQYLVYSPAAIAATLAPSDAEMHQYYQDNLAHYRTDPQVRVSHIFFAAARDASAADKAAARAKAEAALAELKAHPDAFAQIAAKESQDGPSAANGGDLGFVTRGSTAGGPAFDDAAFGLKQGEISGVVESDLGFHILKATEVKPAVVQPFDSVKETIAAALKQRDANKAYGDTADALSSMVYEQAKSLQPTADKYKLTLQTATVTRQPNPAFPPTNPLNNAKFLAAVFAADSVKSGNNTQAIDVGNSTLIAAHVTHYQPAAVPPLDSIKEAVRAKYVAEQAAQLAQKAGEAQLAALQKSKSADGFSPVAKISRMPTQGLPADVLSGIFKADPKALPAYVGASAGDLGYAIYRVVDVVPPAPIPPQQLAGAQQQLAQATAQAELQAYLRALRDRAKVKMYGSVTSAADASK